MILSALLALTLAEPSLEQAQACRAHMEILIEDVARDGGHVAGPTWFIRDWWERQAEQAGAPDDDGADLTGVKIALGAMSIAEPERFEAERQACVDTAIEAGAVPGMGPA